MKSINYKITCKGEIISGYNLEKVKKNNIRLFKLNEKQSNKIFSGVKLVLKSNITYEQALKYRCQFKSLELITYFEEEPVTTSTVRQVIGEKATKMSKQLNSIIEPPVVWSMDFSGSINYINVQLIIYLLFVVCAVYFNLSFYSYYYII